MSKKSTFEEDMHKMGATPIVNPKYREGPIKQVRTISSLVETKNAPEVPISARAGATYGISANESKKVDTKPGEDDLTVFNQRSAIDPRLYVEYPLEKADMVQFSIAIPKFNELVRFLGLASARFVTALVNGEILNDDFTIDSDPLLNQSTILPNLLDNIEATRTLTSAVLNVFPGDTLKESFASYTNTFTAYIFNCLRQILEDKSGTDKDFKIMIKPLLTHLAKDEALANQHIDNVYPEHKFPFETHTAKIGTWVDITPLEMMTGGQVTVDDRRSGGGNIDIKEVTELYRSNLFNRRVKESAERVRQANRRSATYAKIIEEAIENPDDGTALERVDILRTKNIKNFQEYAVNTLARSIDETEVVRMLNYIRSDEFIEHVVQARTRELEELSKEVPERSETSAEDYISMVLKPNDFIETMSQYYTLL